LETAKTEPRTGIGFLFYRFLQSAFNVISVLFGSKTIGSTQPGKPDFLALAFFYLLQLAVV
jgi:hypothetical protein